MPVWLTDASTRHCRRRATADPAGRCRSGRGRRPACPTTSTVCSGRSPSIRPGSGPAGRPRAGHGGDAAFDRFHRLTALDELAWRMRIEGSLRPARAGVQRSGGRAPAALPRRPRRPRGRLHRSSTTPTRRRGSGRRPTSPTCSTTTPARGCTAPPSTGATASWPAGRPSGSTGDVQPRGWTDRGGLEPVTVDAVIVGSGPGGATAADVLTAAGWSVVIVEKGRNHLLDPDDLSRPAVRLLQRRDQVPQPALPRSRPPGRAPDLPDRARPTGTASTSGRSTPCPTTVGGGGTHADGKVPRFRARRLPCPARVLGPQPGAEVADWPLDYDELEPYYAEVERAIGVAGTEGANPFAAPRSGPFPMPSGAPDVRGHPVGRRGRAARLPPLPGPDRGQQRPLRRPAGLQQLRLLRVLRLPHPRQGRPHRHAAARPWRPAGPSCWPRPSCPGCASRGAGPPGSTVIGPDGSRRGSWPPATWSSPPVPSRRPGCCCSRASTTPLIGRYLMAHFQTITAGSMPVPDLRRAGPVGHPRARRHDRGGRRLRAAAAEAGLPWLRGGLVEHSGAGLPIMEAKHFPWGEHHPS